MQQVYTVFTNRSTLKRMELGGLILEKLVKFLCDLIFEKGSVFVEKAQCKGMCEIGKLN